MIHARPLDSNWQPIGEVSEHVTDRVTVVQAMARVLAISTVEFDDDPGCWELLLVCKSPVGAKPYSRPEVDDCLADALETARVLRQQMEVSHVA